MDKLKFGFLITAVATTMNIVECACNSGTLYATENRATKYVQPIAHHLCTLYIRPSGIYNASLYYLKITWDQSDFDVRGKMPLCDGDYVSVFITR